jgi:hypothetical protein
MPIYKVTHTINGALPNSERRMVEAANKTQALAHVAKDSITVESIDAKAAVELSQTGVKIEQANGAG